MSRYVCDVTQTFYKTAWVIVEAPNDLVAGDLAEAKMWEMAPDLELLGGEVKVHSADLLTEVAAREGVLVAAVERAVGGEPR